MKYNSNLCYRPVIFSFLSSFLICGVLSPLSTVEASQNHNMSDFSKMPINIVEDGVTPRVLINASNDHQLYFKAYDDYSDLDGDGTPETTYKHSIDYYGYFDSYKCYTYDTSDLRFEPANITSDKYCNPTGVSGQWSGNFLNWVSMSRIDSIRKVLFGGHRRVDTDRVVAADNTVTPAVTVLERSYLPHDAHSWAKYYSGADIPQLTPFTRSNYHCDAGNTDSCKDGAGNIDWKKVGITLANTTDVDMSLYNNKYSEDYNAPPLIKVVKGNYSLWASNERWQCTWNNSTIDSHGANNSNDSAQSLIYAYSSSPNWDKRLGEGNYTARVQVCVDGLINTEKCKAYPGADLQKNTADDVYKPIGLLQKYGDDESMYFGMVSGSYNNHASGGVLIRNSGTMTDEVNASTNGIFPKVAQYAGGPSANNSAEGLINAWSLYRIIGYDGDEGTYGDNQGDNCDWGLSNFSDVTAPNRCRNWGNPFSEIYYQSINYLAGGGVIGAYRDNSSNIIPGLPVPQSFTDPLDDDSYCADLFVINLNASTVSYDSDELDNVNYGPPTIWDDAKLPGDKTSSAMTDSVGIAEGIHGKSYYVGEVDINSGTDNQLCTSKTINNLGKAGGICPEAPRLSGSYRIAGLAYYSHVEDIRPENATGNRSMEGIQTVDTYSVALASGAPAISIPDPENVTGSPIATILPACRNTSFDPQANCALVDFKIVSQSIDTTGKIATGTFYINWEDSEQGGDFDQDMWGTLTYNLNKNSQTLSITTQVHAESTPYKLGFGYVVEGTTDDGFHVHSGIEQFKHTEIVAVDSGSPDCSDNNGCAANDPASTKTYTIGTSTTNLLKDPLWYASKYGGFIDSNNNKLPDLREEWDSKINSTGASGPDGIPDNYFYATNPKELEDSLNRVLNAILDRTSSGTAAAVVSNNVRGEGALYQAYYEPRRKDDTKEASWLGTLQALWLDSYGYSRQDCTPPADKGINADGTCAPVTGSCVPNGILDNYCVDEVVETYFDELEGHTRMRVYQSNDPDEFTALSMQGVVSAYTNGAVTLKPNGMEGMSSLSGNTLTITPYEVQGQVTAYNPDTGEVEATISNGDWTGPANLSFSSWAINVSSGPGQGYSNDTISLTSGTDNVISFTLSPSGSWISIGDSLTLKTKNIEGPSGQRFEDWDVFCLDPVGATGFISQGGIQLNDTSPTVTSITTTQGDFSGCSRARLTTYNMKGTEGDQYSSWQVENLQTNIGRGTSNSNITLANSGTVSFTVSPTDNWLTTGDQIRIANFLTTAKDLNEVGYIWNAREELYLPGVSDSLLAQNRTYSTSAEDGRHIMTWVDSNLNNIIDDDEYRPFISQMLNDPTFPVSYSFFDVSTQNEAESIIDYVRGIEQSNTRNRTIKYSSGDTSQNIMRLGDIISSTPTSVGAPQEAFDLLYYDSSYLAFRKQYIDRRNVVYVGANDGLIHAFNAGFYTTVNVGGETLVTYSKAGTKYDGSTATEHPLGSELWAYAPMNLLSHLQWLKEPGYSTTHVDYIDAKPRAFDAKIFDSTDDDHPNGWGTVMVIGMNLGGGAMTVPVDHDNNVDTAAINVVRRSAYVIFDITNPEVAPQLLGEIQIPDGSFTTVYPAAFSFQDVNGEMSCNSNTTECNSWYLLFGTGPDNLTTHESSKTTKAYFFDLRQLVTGVPAPTITNTTYQNNCSVSPIASSNAANGTSKTYHMMACDTGMNNTFMGTPSVVDWDLDSMADSAYFGLVRDSNTDAFSSNDEDSGRVMKISFADDASPTSWKAPATVFNADKPLSIIPQPVPSIDKDGNHWLFFGSGRYYSSADKLNSYSQYLFGVKDLEVDTTYPVTMPNLLDVTAAEVYTDGTLETSLIAPDNSTLATFDDIVDNIDAYDSSKTDNTLGWYLKLPPIVGTEGGVPSTRNTTRSALLGGTLFTSVFQPSEDPCEGEGRSRLYGMYYKTGTSYPKIPPIFGSSIETIDDTVKYKTKRFIELGKGQASAPGLHSGCGDGSVKVTTQLSTGEMIQSDANTVNTIRSGRISWKDQ